MTAVQQVSEFCCRCAVYTHTHTHTQYTASTIKTHR